MYCLFHGDLMDWSTLRYLRSCADFLEVNGSYRECQLRAVLFFPSPGFFPQGFFHGKVFLRRQSFLVHLYHGEKGMVHFGDMCTLKWFFPIGFLVKVYFYFARFCGLSQTSLRLVVGSSFVLRLMWHLSHIPLYSIVMLL